MLAKNILIGPRLYVKETINTYHQLYKLEKNAIAYEMEKVQAEQELEARLNRIIFDYV
jgi:ABC-type Na+ transport system ATPase subunit NatA